MKRASRSIRMTVAATLVGCGHGHSHDEAGHEHGGGGADELPGQSVTLWTDKHELFMEYRPLLVGQEVGFAAHVTALPSFKALDKGVVTVAVAMESGPAVNGRADVASPPGIFRPKLVPAQPGKCHLTVTIAGAGGEDRIDAGACQVFADVESARKALGAEEEAPGRITYLKEQQWKTTFATQVVGMRDLQPGVRAAGTIRPAAGREARLTAPATGRVVLAEPMPVIGMTVEKGHMLGAVAPRLDAGGDRASLDADVAAARAELDGAVAQQKRSERLLADQAIPERQLEEARTRVAVARARLSAATGRLGQYAAGTVGPGRAGPGALQLRSPIRGVVVAVQVASGQTVEEGTPLLTVMDLDRVWLEVQIYEPDIPRVENARAAWFTVEGRERRFEVNESNGRVVALGRALDPETRTVPLLFELDNTDGLLRARQFARVVVAAGEPVRALAIPDSAVVEDAGKEVAYVQIEGEAFERRPLALGIRAAGWIEVKEGLAAGEHVVTEGAYEVKLASAAGSVPAHGHVH
jgi:membrane fusion protein, heavy metal efflux system